VSLASVPRRRLVLGAAGVATYGAMAWWSLEYRIRRAEVPLYSETVAFLSPGWRELVPTGHTDTLVPGTRVLAGRPLSTKLVEDELAWLEESAPWVATALDSGDDVLRSALLDLRALSVGLPVSVAGWSDRWRYAWPRDVSFVATALARIGHPEHAAKQLAFLQEVQRQDGVFEARYDPNTRRTPDERVAQLDGSAWVVWGARQLAAAAPGRAVELLTPLKPMLVRSATRLMAVIDSRTHLPKASSDYWELVERSVTLGTAASVLAGLRSATEVLPLVGEPVLAERTRAAAESLSAAVHDQFGAAGYPRLLDDSAADAAVTFLAAPIGPAGADDSVLTAMARAQAEMSRPAGGVAPGVGWKDDGISWTPETALFAAAWAASGHRDRAEELLGWLGAHRTDAGSFPEKVLYDGRPAAVAPLAWTAALVVIARHELVHG
jgi:GH15 family glucan-1,4-alpha-glucosidase